MGSFNDVFCTFACIRQTCLVYHACSRIPHLTFSKRIPFCDLFHSWAVITCWCRNPANFGANDLVIILLGRTNTRIFRIKCFAVQGQERHEWSYLQICFHRTPTVKQEFVERYLEYTKYCAVDKMDPCWNSYGRWIRDDIEQWNNRLRLVCALCDCALARSEPFDVFCPQHI